MENKKLNELIIAIRNELQEMKIQKSGKNKFAGFEYFELKDFLPNLNKLMHEKGVNDKVTFVDGEAKLTLIYKDEQQDYIIPFTVYPTPQKMQDIQYLGALLTYYKRYLYQNAFGITDGEVIDSMDNNDAESLLNKTEKEQVQKVSSKRKLIKFIDDHELNLEYVINKYQLKKESTEKEAEEVLMNLQTLSQEALEAYKHGNN